MDYKIYVLSLQELCFTGMISVAISGVISFLFYQSVWGMAILPVVFIFFKRLEEKRRLLNRKEKLHQQFMEGLKALENALQAGYSMENAWIEAEKELGGLYGKTSDFYRELEEINRLVKNNVPIEKLIEDFAMRTGIDDAEQFAAVFRYGKRSGANWGKIIQTSIYRIQEKYEMKKQVDAMLAGKKMEMYVMCVMPLFLLFFLRLTSREYMECLYHNLSGILCMSIALAGYVGAVVLADKTLKIQV
uniref:type II secretion system F family protein n=1 Tax=Agathobacter sp. TaxID=2021311 RepID=UPI0040579B5B